MQKTLRLRDRQYSELLTQWKTAVARVYKYRDDTSLTSYCVPAEAEDDELQFSAFGMKLYMRFRHSFESGIIEYGVITRSEIVNQELKVPVATVTFDHNGNIRPPHDWHPVSQYERVHWGVLASHLDDFVKKAYGLEVVNE